MLLWVSTQTLYGQSSYSNVPLIQIINDIENSTSYRFLYREALISNLRLTVDAGGSPDLFENLQSRLARHQIAMRVDSTRKQIVIYKSKEYASPTRNIEVSGYVVDATSGERLPYATLYWKKNGRLQGTTANSAGHFTLSENSVDSALLVTASYVGYASRSTAIGEGEEPGGVDELTIRLTPESIGGNEIIVTGQNYFASQDTLISDYVDIGNFSPLGEPNTLRALQLLPSVGIGTAMSNGLNVRGSATDGLHVLLDGISIFNQSHLFGLLDSFNADVLRRSSLFYDITPAQFQAPPGGTLRLFTKTGSLNKFHSTVGVSNSSYRATLEGPIKKGKSSWVLSGRHSYMNTVNWLNNSDLIEWGLNINRPREAIDPNLVDVESRLVTPGAFQARFFDAHGKLYFEGDHGNRFYISGYYGGDDTDQSAERLIRKFDESTSTSVLAPIDVETTNKWNNFAGSMHYEHSFSPTVYSHTSASISVYETDYDKRDFTYVQFDDESNLQEAFIFPFENRSIINELKGEQRLDVDFRHFLWTIGGSYQYYLGEYFENSFDRPGFFIHESAHKADAYTQFDFNRWNYVRINTGARMHYYSNGSFLRVSPRAKLELFPN
ncbi:MAG: carboxypeptidase-like regulatory domain-containing protein, partial [Balneolaceae bacterium]|nr:carboxypeptidase-like regulatory domain-containing protein [Balneolaceae bacterium]